MVNITQKVPTILLLSCLSSCSTNDFGTSAGSNQLTGTNWQLKAFEIVGDSTTPVQSGDTIYLYFETSNEVGGEALGLCQNYYSGFYLFTAPNGLSVDSLGTTEQGCLPGSRYFEFFHALDSVSSFDISEGMLYLYYAERARRLVLSVR